MSGRRNCSLFVILSRPFYDVLTRIDSIHQTMAAPGPSPGSAWRSILVLAVAAAQPQRKDLTIFYNVYMHNNRTARARTPVVVQQQLAAVKRSPAWPAVAEVRFATIGDPRGRETVLHACRKAAIGASKCVHLGHTTSGSEATTLAPLHDFCRAHPRALVAYLHAGFRKTGALRRAALRGMASSACARALRGDTCDVCAMRFSPLPYAHVPANMWMARCAYVRDLAPPAEFRRLVDALWRGKDAQSFGHGRHALGHWVGSHPSLRACDTLAGPYGFGAKLTAALNALPRPNFPLRFADAPRDGKNPCGTWGSHRKQACQRTYRDVLEEWREIYGWVPASSRSRLKRYYLAQEKPRPRRRLAADGAVVFYNVFLRPWHDEAHDRYRRGAAPGGRELVVACPRDTLRDHRRRADRGRGRDHLRRHRRELYASRPRGEGERAANAHAPAHILYDQSRSHGGIHPR